MEKSMNIRGHQFPHDCGENGQSDSYNDISLSESGANLDRVNVVLDLVV
jgi:hypothetical protein